MSRSEDEAAHEIAVAALRVPATPQRVFLPGAAQRRFAAVARRLAQLGEAGPACRAAYSVKTNPDRALLETARRHGMFAETIGPQEYALARSCGFHEHEIVYNGPVPFDRSWGGLAFAFADSPGAFAHYLDTGVRVAGIRLRPPGVTSRFGIREHEMPAIRRLLSERGTREIALSAHARAQDIVAPQSWSRVFDAVVAAGSAIEAETPTRIVALDVGGGRDAAAFDELLRDVVPAALERLRVRLPHVRSLLFEPGQEVATSCACLVTGVVETRLDRSPREIVIDTNVMQLSYKDSYPHRLYAWSGEQLQQLGRGADRILGAACLEDDVIAEGVALPALRAGDRIVIADCGSYDASMASPFATGTVARVRPGPDTPHDPQHAESA